MGLFMNNQWKGFFAGVVTTCLLIIGTSAVCRIFHFYPFGKDLSTSIAEKIDVVEDYIDNYYIGTVSKEDLRDGAVKGMVEALEDKYSIYYTDEEYKSVMASVNGSYSGIGATVIQEEKSGNIIIYEVSKGGAAEQAGLKKGDIIKSVDGKNVGGQKLDDVISLVRGEEGTKVVLEILRAKQSLRIEITRATIKNISIHSKMLKEKIGYIQISDFDDESPKQFETALNQLEKENMQGLIVDVRNNGGGSLTAVVSMLDRMLPKGTLLTVKEKNQKDEVYKSTDEKSFNKPCIVLINENSASASEVFAGAMQDRKAATLVGVTSYGKGVVQSIYSLENSCGGGLRLTTAKYYLPSNRCIHEVGLTPDIEVKYTGDKEKYKESTDNQLSTAIEEMEKKIEPLENKQ